MSTGNGVGSCACGTIAARRGGVALATAVFVAVVAPSAAYATAAGTGTEAAVMTLAQAEGQRQYNIPAQPLGQALVAFGRQAGLQVAVDSEAVSGKQTSGVSGTMTAAQALDRLLAGSGLSYRFTSARGVSIETPASDDEATTQPITVEGNSVTSRGPVNGYVAYGSAAGTKTDTPLVKTPQSISVVTRDQMDRQAVQNVDQSLRYTAGIMTETAGVDDRFDQVAGRGFSLDEYLDGTKFLYSSSGFAVPQVDPYLLERAEVLRGPASVLYGQASPGGIVNLVSKRPTEKPLHEVQVQAGSYDQKQAAFDFSGPLDEDGTFLYRITGLARENDTQVDHTKYERYFIAPSLTWRPTDDTSLTILTDYQDDPQAGFFNKLPAQGTALPNSEGEIPTDFYAGEPDFDKFDRDMTTAGYAFEHRFSDVWTVRQNLRYLHMNADFAAVFASGTLQSDGHTLNRQVFTSLEDLDGLTLDNQVQAKFETGSFEHTLLFGLDYQWRRWEQLGGFGLGPSIDFLNPVYGQAISTPGVFADQVQMQRQTGLYAQDEVGLGGWSLLFGGRWDRASSNTKNRLTHVTTNTNDHALTGRIGLSYLFDNGIAPYVSYAESFQPVTGTDFNGNPFEPTTGRQYEAGIKYQPDGVNSFVTFSAFDLTQQNVLTPDPDPAHPNANVQTGKLESQGLELEGKAEFSKNFSAILSYAYLDAEVKQANDGTQGNRPVSVPSHMASAWIDYTLDKGDLAGLGVSAGVRYLGSSYGDSANTYKIDDATLVDAGLHYDLGTLSSQLDGTSLSLNATNLFDKTYVARCQDTGCYYGLRRTVLATLKYKW